MSKNQLFPKIKILLAKDEEDEHNTLYRDAVYYTLKKIIPPSLRISYPENPTLFFNQLNQMLPIISKITCAHAPGKMSFYFLAKYRANTFKFFYEMVSRWLIPGRRLNVVLVHAIDFWMPEFGSQLYTVCEVTVAIDSQQEIETIKQNLPIIETEVRLGITSQYYARRILEIKGLANDEKTALIQEDIATMVKRLPKAFDQGVFAEMQHLLVLCPDTFKQQRSSRHLSKIIGTQYLFRKQLQRTAEEQPNKRHLRLKLFKAWLSEKREVTALLIAFNYLSPNEVLEESHVLKAVHYYCPTAKCVENSCFLNQRTSGSICTLYLEIEENEGQPLSGKQLLLLRRELADQLENHIGQLVQPVFMPRNEEEVMRNIFHLSKQIRYVRDIPQVVITFDEQTASHLVFTIILVRAVRYNAPSIERLFKTHKSSMQYIHDRCKEIGMVRKRYPKEVTVFRLKFPKTPFLRHDRSVDLYRARQAVVSEINLVVGEIRDFNGGMISKQSELLEKIRIQLKEGNLRYHDFLLENFFFSLTPVIMRTVMEPEILKHLFLLMQTMINQGADAKETRLRFCRELRFAYAIVATTDLKVEEEIQRGIRELEIDGPSVVQSRIPLYGTTYLGYLYRCADSEGQQIFCDTIEEAVAHAPFSIA